MKKYELRQMIKEELNEAYMYSTFSKGNTFPLLNHPKFGSTDVTITNIFYDARINDCWIFLESAKKKIKTNYKAKDFQKDVIKYINDEK